MSEPNSAPSDDANAESESTESIANRKAYFRSGLNVILVLLPAWAFVSYGCAILFRDWMDANMPQVGNAPFGFWMAQQGSIICFVIILIVYAIWMNRLDHKFKYNEEN